MLIFYKDLSHKRLLSGHYGKNKLYCGEYLTRIYIYIFVVAAVSLFVKLPFRFALFSSCSARA